MIEKFMSLHILNKAVWHDILSENSYACMPVY